MLRENPQLRPNIYQVVREVCILRGTDTPIKDVCLSAAYLYYADHIRSTLLGHLQKFDETSNYLFPSQM